MLDLLFLYFRNPSHKLHPYCLCKDVDKLTVICLVLVLQLPRQKNKVKIEPEKYWRFECVLTTFFYLILLDSFLVSDTSYLKPKIHSLIKNSKHIRNNPTLALKGQILYSINRLLDMLPKSIQLTGCTVSDPNYLHRLSKKRFVSHQINEYNVPV